MNDVSVTGADITRMGGIDNSCPSVLLIGEIWLSAILLQLGSRYYGFHERVDSIATDYQSLALPQSSSADMSKARWETDCSVLRIAYA